jgi:hypothetical protein
MDKRISERIKSDNQYIGELILASKIKILDITISGICLETSEHLTTNNIYRIELVPSNNETITPKCVVVWSSLRRTVKEKGYKLSIYRSGLKFIELTDSEKLYLESYIKGTTKKCQ